MKFERALTDHTVDWYHLQIEMQPTKIDKRQRKESLQDNIGQPAHMKVYKYHSTSTFPLESFLSSASMKIQFFHFFIIGIKSCNSNVSKKYF